MRYIRTGVVRFVSIGIPAGQQLVTLWGTRSELASISGSHRLAPHLHGAERALRQNTRGTKSLMHHVISAV